MKRYSSPGELLTSIEQLLAAHRPTQDRVSPLEQVCEVLYEGRHYFWIGIYLVLGERVVRQAFRGPVPPCHEFAFGQGNVGTTGQRGITKVIPDVAGDPTYSMCFLETKSEIVVPIKIAGRMLGVIDVESDQLNAFGAEDRVLLESVADRLARFLTGAGKYLVRKARERESTGSTSHRDPAGGEAGRATPQVPEKKAPEASPAEPVARAANAAGERTRG